MIEEFYNKLVDDYYKSEQSSPHSQVGQLMYYNRLTLDEAIEEAVFGRYLVKGHQYFSYHYRFFFEVQYGQTSARDKLLTIRKELQKCNDFLSLYNEVRRVTQDISKKMGQLFYYDTALRIGACKDINLTPKHVFLQRGSLEGAEATGISLADYSYETPYVRKIAFSSLSRKIKGMEAQDLEALLCVYHREIEKMMKRFNK